ncbi:MAG: hypothetical protein ABII90_08270 [Bacteroidota bacterium]
MPDSLSKVLSFALYILIGLSVVLAILFYLGFIAEDPLIYWTYLLFIVATVTAIVFPVYFIIINPKGAKMVLIGLGILILFFVIAYLLASDQVFIKYESYGIDAAASKRVGTGLIATYLLGIGAVVAIIYSGISSMFK